MRSTVAGFSATPDKSAIHVPDCQKSEEGERHSYAGTRLHTPSIGEIIIQLVGGENPYDQ